MEGKKALHPSQRAAGLAAVDEGTSINQGLLDALRGYEQACSELQSVE